MTSIGKQAREAAARTHQSPEIPPEKNAATTQDPDLAKKPTGPRKVTARERVAATAEAVFANRFMPGSNIHDPSGALITQLRDQSLSSSTGGEVDLSERDAFKTLSKVSHQAISLPMSGLALAIRQEYREASGAVEKPTKTGDEPSMLDQVKTSFKEGMESTKPAARRKKTEGMEL